MTHSIEVALDLLDALGEALDRQVLAGVLQRLDGQVRRHPSVDGVDGRLLALLLHVFVVEGFPFGGAGGPVDGAHRRHHLQAFHGAARRLRHDRQEGQHVGSDGAFVAELPQRRVERDRVLDRGAEIDEVYKDLHKEIQSIEKRLLIEIKSLKLDISDRVSMLEKYKWLILGGSIVIGFILSSNFKMIVQMFS